MTIKSQLILRFIFSLCFIWFLMVGVFLFTETNVKQFENVGIGQLKERGEEGTLNEGSRVVSADIFDISTQNHENSLYSAEHILIDNEDLQSKKQLPGDLQEYNPNEKNIDNKISHVSGDIAVLQDVNELPQSTEQTNGRNDVETGIVSNKFELRKSNKNLIHEESVEINDSPVQSITLKYLQGGIPRKATEQNGWINVLPEDTAMENGQSEDTGTIMVAGLASDRKQAFGEMGQPVNINVEQLNQTERDRYQALFKRNYFNEYASEKISLHRTLPDKRDESCLTKIYGKNLPDTAIIICFHNEAWSTLLRTVHSVLDRSPPHLVREIILIDDFSDLDHLKAPLDNYISTLPKVRLIRLPQREGLIRARLVGYRNATAPVLTFLDSHVECLIGWLEPLFTF
ncbi:uncharacterized protein LOC126815837 [Patella vulgata]|uniref:uncharacterized protein LOC126815837 n=1 Tax=Patella vulgata TaxID=6465 RepID=UPI0024A81198|nr:uncharacterized protein LOC126815837 [Patella vulgata]